LRKKDSNKSKPKGVCTERFTQVIGNARAEEIGQRGEQEVERAGETKEVSQFIISNLRF
jgi:hypothetical protein